MADSVGKTRLDIAKEKAREKAQRDVAKLNKRAIDVLNTENPELIAAVFDVLDAEDAVSGNRKEKLNDENVKAKREIVRSFTPPQRPSTPGYSPSGE